MRAKSSLLAHLTCASAISNYSMTGIAISPFAAIIGNLFAAAVARHSKRAVLATNGGAQAARGAARQNHLRCELGAAAKVCLHSRTAGRSYSAITLYMAS